MAGLPQPELPPAPLIRRHVLTGFLAVGIGFAGFLAWLFAADLAAAVMAPGQIIVETDVKKVQHQMGGTIGEIRARNGDRIRAGDLLVRLDDTQARSSLGIVTSQLTQLGGRRARLEAERDGRDRLQLPPDFHAGGAEAENVARGEQRLLSENREFRQAQVEQLRERSGQYEREIEGLTAQQNSNRRQAELIRSELQGVQELFEKNLVPLTRLTALQRDAVRLEGENGALTASIAKARGQIAEIALQLISVEQKARAEAVKELREVEAQIAQLVERKVAASDVLARIEIRAPQSGYVHESKVQTIGGVIAPGETIMMIVPDNDKLAIEMRVSPVDIDQIHLGQKAILRFSAFNQRTTPELIGTLTRIGADAVREPQTGMTYYVARAHVSEAELKKINGLVLSPGMPVEVFVETGSRSAWSYFAKPLTDAFRRAFREE